MKLILKQRGFEVWFDGVEYWLYGATVSGDVLICPSMEIVRAKMANA